MSDGHCAHLATRACAGEAILLLQALLSFPVPNIQGEVALRDLLTSRQVVKSLEVCLQGTIPNQCFCCLV